MSPLRLAERRHLENVGAPLVTPGKPPATLTRTTRNAAAASCHDGSGLHKWNPCGHRRETADRIYGMADRYFWMADRNSGTAGRENGRPLCRGRRGVGLMSWLSCVLRWTGRFAVPAAGSRIEASEGPLAGDCRIFRRTGRPRPANCLPLQPDGGVALLPCE